MASPIYLDMNNCIQYLTSSDIYYEYNLFIAYYMYYLNVGDCILPVPISPAALLCLPLSCTLASHHRRPRPSCCGTAVLSPQTGSNGACRQGLGAGTAGWDLPWCWQGTCPPAQPPRLSESSVFQAALNLAPLRMVGGFIAIKPWARLKDI